MTSVALFGPVLVPVKELTLARENYFYFLKVTAHALAHPALWLGALPGGSTLFLGIFCTQSNVMVFSRLF